MAGGSLEGDYEVKEGGMITEKFWVVFVEGQGSRVNRHVNVTTARAEAVRLAKETGNPAYLLEAMEG